MASIWFELWAAYYPTELSRGIYALSGEALRRLRVEIRIDVSPNSPYSRYAQEQALENLFQKGVITFEEYVAALDENAAAPKQKLEDILRNRQRDAGPNLRSRAEQSDQAGWVEHGKERNGSGATPPLPH